VQSDRVSTPSDAYTLHVGTNVEYAPYVEYGVKGRPGQPYLKTALDESRKDIPKLYREEVRRALG